MRSVIEARITQAMIAPNATRTGLSPEFHFAFFKNGIAAVYIIKVVSEYQQHRRQQ
jgi:hypothetical protein